MLSVAALKKYADFQDTEGARDECLATIVISGGIYDGLEKWLKQYFPSKTNTNPHLIYVQNPIPAGDTADHSCRQVLYRITQPLDHLVQACERLVAESPFADLFPDLLDRVHLRGIRRDKCKVNVLRDLKPVRPVPSGSVTNQEQLIIRIRLCHLMQKHIHASSIAIRQYKKESITGPCFYCSVRIPVFPYMVTWHGRPHSFLAPAVLRLIDPPESCFILEQQPYSLFGEFSF